MSEKKNLVFSTRTLSKSDRYIVTLFTSQMLRCGQMVLAQSLIDLHLGRDWFWTSTTTDPTYLKIVNRFEDSRKSPFSIHQIALMGDSEDKKVGEWFGPNTVAQVLR